MVDEQPDCWHSRGKIISYNPWAELCYDCMKLLKGDPRLGPREVVDVQPELVELLMRPGVHAGVR